jgi:GTPase
MQAERRHPGVPLVAVVGRPNVGKSSLVNRVLGRREAIVEERPGVTRDRRGFIVEWAGRRFEMVDTGGLEPGAKGLEARVVEQARAAIDMADVVVLVVDAGSGPEQDDHEVATLLRRAGKPVVLAVNKVDDAADEPAAATFHRLGLGEPIALSALHGRGAGDFLDTLVDRLPGRPPEEVRAWGSVAVVGRPNVGKSSILNALLGEARAVVDPAPGTTRDPVDSYLPVGGGRVLRIVDTAGLRRQVQIKDPLEYFGWLRSRRTLARVDAVVLVVDASEGATGHDQRIAEDVLAAGRACVVALNKWDLVPDDPSDRSRLERDVREHLRFLSWATEVRTSALTGRGIDRLAPAVAEAIEAHRRRLPTAAVNRVVHDAQDRSPHPRSGGKAVRIMYAVQARAAPPTVVLFATGKLDPSYVRYLERQMRAAEPFAGTPVRFEVKVRPRREG